MMNKATTVGAICSQKGEKKNDLEYKEKERENVREKKERERENETKALCCSRDNARRSRIRSSLTNCDDNLGRSYLF